MSDTKKIQEEKLIKIIVQQPLIIGIGNTLRGDDAAGIAILNELESLGYPLLFNCGANPENYLYQIAKYKVSCRLWADIIHFGGEPGDWRIFNREEISVYDISTHSFSPDLLAKFLDELQAAEDYFLGIQPQQTNLGQPLSEAVQTTIYQLAQTIIGVTRN